jgi:allantoin racemase
MKLAIINPNSTKSMTKKCEEVAFKFKNSDTEIWASNPTNSPKSIEGHYDEIRSLAGLMDEILKAKEWGADAYVIACFDDPGLEAARELVDGPVIGICEAAMHMTSIISSSFSVVTTLNRSVPIIEELSHKYGMDKFCRKVRAADIPVLALENGTCNAMEKIETEILKAVKEDNCEAIILGCAGMADLTIELSKRCNIPVVDGVLCAIKMAESLVGAKLLTSKINAYAYPIEK